MFTIKSDNNILHISEGSFQVFNISKQGIDIYKDDFLIFSFCSNKKIKIKNGIVNIEESINKICTQLEYICLEYIKNNNVLEIGFDNNFFLSNLTRNLVLLNTDRIDNIQTETCWLSKRPMVQKDDMILPCHIDVPGYKRVNIIDLETLESKYFTFDTIIVNAKNALFYILCDFPNFLNSIQLIIFKNNFTELQKYNFVISKLNNFKKIYYETIPEKYEVFKRM